MYEAMPWNNKDIEESSGFLFKQIEKKSKIFYITVSFKKLKLFIF